MKLLWLAVLAVLLGTSAVLAAVEVRVPAAAPIVPLPTPLPISAIKLTDEMVFMVDSDVPCDNFVSPAGKLKVTPLKGPLTVRGKFVDSPAKVEMREFKGPYLYLVEPAGTGLCELIVSPRDDTTLRIEAILAQTGLSAEKKLEAIGATIAQAKLDPLVPIRRTIVLGGQEPSPEPKPRPDPPIPPDPDNAIPGVAWIIVVEETSRRTPALAEFYSEFVFGPSKAWLAGKGIGFRTYDKDSLDASRKQYLSVENGVGDVASLPAVLYLDVTGKKLKSEPLPATPEKLKGRVK